ncbi:profilin [Mycena olivaceomarginata]|nr:profilin [Mycena olivaceomarginata]
MSWQGRYLHTVDTNLVGTGAISKAAILGQQGGVWAASQAITKSRNAIVGAFKDLTSVQASGLRLAGVKFFTTTTDERTINGKKGVRRWYVIVKTVQAIIAQEAAKVVQSLADYLIDLKY